MDKLTVTLKTVTPLFLGGANPNEKAELRSPSIKGALRFWYRAIDPDYKLNEPKIFGSIDSGQSKFSVRIASQKILKGDCGEENWNKTKIAYLGYGPINRGKTTRPYIKSGNEFIIEIAFKPKTKVDERLAVEKSLWALLMFGVLGSRSRKGFGSLVVTKIQDAIFRLPWQFNNIVEFKKSISDFWKDIQKPIDLQEYTRWSNNSRCVVVNEKESGEAALEWLGKELHNYRSYYGDKPCNFLSDHDNMLNYLKSGTVPLSPPLRTAFGLPHNYFFTRSLKGVSGAVNLIEGDQKGRRASPLFLHIQELQTEKACIVATFLPARLIPIDKKITISGNRQTDKELGLPDNFTAVDKFIDRLKKYGEEIK